MKAIPRDAALLICAAIRRENHSKWYSFTGLQCWSCIRFSKGDLAKMYISKGVGYRGCKLINRRYAQLSNVEN